MADIEISVDRRTAIGHVELNRPQKLNAITPQMQLTLLTGVAQLCEDPEVSCIVLSGRGRAFSAGYDMSTPNDDRGSIVDDWMRQRQKLNQLFELQKAPIPIVAAVHGFCYAAGCVLATMADLIVVAKDLKWGAARFREGAGYVGPLLSIYIGHRRAAELEYTNGEYSGMDAVGFGWANYAVPAEEVLIKSEALALEVAKSPRDVLELRKGAMVLAARRAGLDHAVDTGAMWNAMSHFAASGLAMESRVRKVGLSGAMAELRPRTSPLVETPASPE